MRRDISGEPARDAEVLEFIHGEERLVLPLRAIGRAMSGALCVSLCAACALTRSGSVSSTPRPDDVLNVMERVADWQLAHSSKHDPAIWTQCAGYAGSEVYRLVGASRPAVGRNDGKPAFRVLAFFTAKKDQAHISFVNEAVRWFPQTAAKYNFRFDTTSDWNNLNQDVLSTYEVVVFLDTRPEDPAQRSAFQAYMEHGGAWMGFHFAGFALTPSAVPANWGWYHDTFLGAGSYVSNSWRPTSAILRVEDRAHPATQHLPATFRSSPNEWYRWEKDLRRNPDIDILVSIDSTSFPLGTGPKPNEIWHGGYYPVVWTNRKYRMMYLNMGHNDIDYEHRFDTTNKTLSYTLNNPIEDQLIIDGLLWLGKRAKQTPRP